MTDRRTLIAQAHLAPKELGLDEETRVDIQITHGGHESCSEMTDAELVRVLDHYRSKGWKAKPGKRAKAQKLADGDQVAKIRALWLQLRDLGELRDPSEAALRAWVKRMTKGIDREGEPVREDRRGEGVDALQWLTVKQAIKVTEELKKWAWRVRRAHAAVAGQAAALERREWPLLELHAFAKRHQAFGEDVAYWLRQQKWTLSDDHETLQAPAPPQADR
jgi:phage gp16-like protein